MNLTKMILAAICVPLLSLPASAQESSRIEHSIRSTHLGQERTVTVQLPPSYYTQTEHDYPVLYLLDGEHNLSYSQAVADFLAQNALVPEIIIVAMHSGATRGRDYRPEYAAGNGAGVSGRADQFLEYLDRELVPFVEANYRAAPLRLISGHSLGGVFVTYAMVERPQVFQAYLTQSPYLDQTIGGPLLERVADALASSPQLAVFYYMNVGDEPDLEQNFERMEAILGAASSDSFVWFAEREAGKTHMTTRLVGQYEALARFFAGDWPLSQEKLIGGGYAGLESHIDALSMKYGYPVLYNEQVFQQATQKFLSQQDLPSATGSARLYARQYPTSPVAHFLVGVTLARGGEREAAVEAIETAIGLYENDPKPDLAPLYENMKRLQQQLAGG